MKAAVQLALAQEKDALVTMQQWVKIEPESGGATLAAYYLKKGDQNGALALADKLIAEKTGSGIGYWLKAKIYLQLGKLNEAKVAVADGLRRDSPSVQLKLLQAGIYEREENFTQAEQVLKQLISAWPDYYPAVFALGVQKDAAGDKSQAKELYEKTLKINSQYIPALNNLAYLLAENFKDLKGALELSIKAYRQMPSSPEIMDTLGYVLLKNGRFKEAIPLLEKAHTAIPENSSVHLHLGMAYQGAGKADKAKDVLEKVLVAGNSEEVRAARKILQVSN
jgi:tetratricopeptide (TPR) repeat protein